LPSFAQETVEFAMANRVASGSSPLGASGTLSGLSDSDRQQYIDYCPELKMMFPSLHNDACFGAEPNAAACFQYLCVTSRLRCGEHKNKKFTSTTFDNGKNKLVTIDITLADKPYR
jgi:hypothetical protein